MEVQHTITSSASLSGRGLFSGCEVTVTFRPAPDDHGIVFVRTDMERAEIPALVTNVVKRPRRTSLKRGEATVDTCEHCLSAIAALKIDNLIIEIDAPELPGLDGSAKPYLDTLTGARVTASERPRRRLAVSEPVMVGGEKEDEMIAAVPHDKPWMEVVYDLDYGPGNPIGRQLHVFDFANGNYEQQIAPARTFVLEREATALHEAGVGTHLSPADVLVIGEEGPLGGNVMRFENEPARHKILDLIGDLYLLGMPLQGRIIAHRSGHAMKHLLQRALLKQASRQSRRDLAVKRNVLDIRKLFRMMPHRYPMLLVDRVLEVDGDRRAVGVKNVTINEPFFQGHYPGTPIMPGVLVVEAMAQLSGVLIGQTLEHTGKLPVLMSLDRCKIRRPVTPGDQLIIEAESVRIRSRIAHMRCRAYVGDELAAEAEVKFMLVDDEKE